MVICTDSGIDEEQYLNDADWDLMDVETLLEVRGLRDGYVE